MFGIILFNNTSNLYTQWLARRLGVISLSLLVLGAPSPVLANSTADGNAGLSALNRGSYREAIRLFTRAIKAGDLAAADQEFAYLNRGKAYLLEGRKTLALADFKTAISLKPDDTEAQEALQTASSSASVQAPMPLQSESNPDAPWGSIIAMVDTYWMAIDKDPEYYDLCRWQTPHLVLSCSSLSKRGKTSASTFVLAPSTSKITYTETVNATQTGADVDLNNQGFALNLQENGKNIRENFIRKSPTTFEIEASIYDGGTWKTGKAFKYVQVSYDVIQALGWKEGKDPSHSFWKDLGKSIAGAAAAGLISGLQGTPQQ
jgi:tetratricopeptide (TPR) repeat protein